MRRRRRIPSPFQCGRLFLGLSQRVKGQVGERWLAEKLRQYGFSARRGQQFRGGPDSPDVICKDLPFHWEMKWGYKGGLSIRAVLKQATQEAPSGSLPVGVWKPQRQRAMAFMYLDDFLSLVKGESDEPT